MIIPVYNVRPYIAECLDSVVSQSYKDLEIIVVDDGSTDGSCEICQEYASRDSRIRLIRQENSGVSAARNAALAVSTGSYITFVDSDDTIPSDAIEHLVEAFDRDPSVRIASGMFNRFDDGKDNYRLMSPKRWYRSVHTLVPSRNLQKAFLSESTHHYVAGTLYARDIFFKHGSPVEFKPGIVDEDTLIMYHIANMMEDNGWSLMEVPYVVYNYRIRKGSLCRQTAASTLTPLRVYRLRNLDFFARDLKERGREDLLPFVQRLRTRTLYMFLREIRRTPAWRGKYWTEYRSMTSDISSATAYKSLTKTRFCRFMAYKHAPSLFL